MKTAVVLITLTLALAAEVFAESDISVAWSLVSSKGWIYSTSEVAEGMKVKLKCVQEGKGSAYIAIAPGHELSMTHGSSSAKKFQPKKGGVLTWTAPKTQQVAIAFLHVPNPISAVAGDGYWILTFEDGWVFHVKVVGEDF